MTGFTGRGFVGFIGVSRKLPETVLSRTGAHIASTVDSSVTLAPPAGIQVGDLMAACVEAGSYGGGEVSSLTPPAGWTTVLDDSTLAVGGIWIGLYTRTADANDAAGTTSYTWSTVVTGTAGMAVAIVGWQSRYGSTVSSPAIDYDDPASIASPGGRWQLAFIVQRTANLFAQPTPDPVVTSAATLFVDAFGTFRSGVMRVYGSDNVTPVIGEYLTTGIDFPRQALVVAAVS